MIADLYYTLKPFIPRWTQLKLRSLVAARVYRRNTGCWPIWEAAGIPPLAWPGWPGGKRFAVVLTHDVETASGVSYCEQLANLEEKRKFRSAFGFVPLRYQTPEWLRRALRGRGFEVMVHDLYHDGKLYRDQRHFETLSGQINEFLRRWGAHGFSSGAMHHNLVWISRLAIDYSISTYDTDPFEPQSCGLGRIFPCWVQSPDCKNPGFVEMPYTMPQDFTLFTLLGQRSNALWRRKLDWIAGKGGMVLIKTHPDYMMFDRNCQRRASYPVELYTDILDYIRARYADDAWLACPADVARFWRTLHGAGGIALHPSFCNTCRDAHAAAWLHQYPDRSGSPLAAPRPAHYVNAAGAGAASRSGGSIE